MAWLWLWCLSSHITALADTVDISWLQTGTSHWQFQTGLTHNFVHLVREFFGAGVGIKAFIQRPLLGCFYVEVYLNGCVWGSEHAARRTKEKTRSRCPLHYRALHRCYQRASKPQPPFWRPWTLVCKGSVSFPHTEWQEKTINWSHPIFLPSCHLALNYLLFGSLPYSCSLAF